ncbi:hypothetical protein DPM13_12450 [Paracoccus mutanolyticus]|uniref:Uncharacterized protein n=2 Tax=Paracoccus mutanolyticus TaxID=1499308 RepID=A0ABM6WUZ7_9RHOB|nr:hypothetical protein DPM13_12450 [Paracoccus mutanolyticus]
MAWKRTCATCCGVMRPLSFFAPHALCRIGYAGHMDEVGFIVHHIDQDGFLFFSTIGGGSTVFFNLALRPMTYYLIV